MCTLSLVTRPDGFLVAMNRDEHVLRPLGGVARRYELGAHTVAHPTDSLAGGTWFGASSAGFVAAVLNNYQAEDPFALRPRSRGDIPLTLLAADSGAEARARLRSLDLAAFRPFRAVLLDPSHGVLVGESDGARLTLAEQPWMDFLLVSSGMFEARVRAHRNQLFQELVTRSRALDDLRDLHFQQDLEQPERGFSMWRPEARSVSYTELQAQDGRWALRHLEAPPIGYDAEVRARLAASELVLKER